VETEDFAILSGEGEDCLARFSGADLGEAVSWESLPLLNKNLPGL